MSGVPRFQVPGVDCPVARAARAATECGDFGESQTLQEFAKDADLNEIVRRCGIRDHDLPAGVVPDLSAYGDRSQLAGMELRDVLDLSRRAEEQFRALPAPIRARFGNSMVALDRFVCDPANAEECVALGLLQAVEEPRRRASDPRPRRRRQDAEDDRRELEEFRRGQRASPPPVAAPK